MRVNPPPPGHAAYHDGTTCTAGGPGTANVSWGWLYIRTSPNEYGIELTVNVNGPLIQTCQPPDGPPGSGDIRPGLAWGAGGCAVLFVPSPPDVKHLQGSVSRVCTDAGGTETATLTWDLTGS